MSLFFSAHYIFISLLKTKMNTFNVLLKNINFKSSQRSISNVFKTLLNNNTLNTRLHFYLSQLVKLYVIKKKY